MRKSAIALVCALASLGQRSVPIENEYVRVLDVTAAPHQKTRLHQHAMNRVMVYLDAGSQRIEYPGHPAADIHWKAGQPLWSPAAGMHTAEIDSVKPVRIIEIELKKPAGPGPVFPALDPVKIDPKHYGVEFENDQVRVIRVKIGPGETTLPHEHKLNRLVVFLTNWNSHKAGEVIWGAAAKHMKKTAGAERFEAIMVELKN